jgi:hypothetical protein
MVCTLGVVTSKDEKVENGCEIIDEEEPEIKFPSLVDEYKRAEPITEQISFFFQQLQTTPDETNGKHIFESYLIITFKIDKKPMNC